MGNVLLARILEYFNGTLFLDDNYRFCVFFIENYIDFYIFLFIPKIDLIHMWL